MQTTDNNKRNGRIAAGIYTVLCLLLLFAFRFPQPEENENEGVIINLGYTETGMTNNVPEAVDTEVNPNTETQETSAEVESVVEESITQDMEESIVATPENTSQEATEVTETVTESTPAEEVVEEQQVNENALFSSNNNNPNEGNGTEAGDQGQENGQLESDIYEGVNSGGAGDEGFGWSLSGRSLTNQPTINDNSQKQGKVTIKIKVNQAGKVISKEFTSLGSTTTDSYLVAKAMEALETVTFNPDPNAPEIQQGTFTFVFKLQ